MLAVHNDRFEQMTVEEAIKALQEKAEYFSYDVPPKIFEQSVEDTASALMFTRSEDNCCQYRSNQEWADLISEENDPLEAAKLVMDWVNDKAQAWEKLEAYEDEGPVPTTRDAVFAALQEQLLPTLRKLLSTAGGEPFEKLVRDKYVPMAVTGGLLDSQEALEASVLDERRIDGAARIWARLSNQERQIVEEVTDRICGSGEGEELAFDLDIRLQPDEEEPE